MSKLKESRQAGGTISGAPVLAEALGWVECRVRRNLREWSIPPWSREVSRGQASSARQGLSNSG